MRRVIRAIAVTGAAAAPAFAQEAAPDMGAQLDAMTCGQFIALPTEDQLTMMLALRAHANGDPLPDEPLPLGVEAEVGGADGLGGDSGRPGAAEGTEAAAEASPADGAGEPAAVEDTVATAEPSPGDVSEESLTGPAVDPKLTAMRTSCLGGPEALARDAMRAAHADYE